MSDLKNQLSYHADLDDLLHTLNSSAANDSKAGRLAFDNLTAIKQLMRNCDELQARHAALVKAARAIKRSVYGTAEYRNAMQALSKALEGEGEC